MVDPLLLRLPLLRLISVGRLLVAPSALPADLTELLWRGVARGAIRVEAPAVIPSPSSSLAWPTSGTTKAAFVADTSLRLRFLCGPPGLRWRALARRPTVVPRRETAIEIRLGVCAPSLLVVLAVVLLLLPYLSLSGLAPLGTRKGLLTAFLMLGVAQSVRQRAYSSTARVIARAVPVVLILPLCRPKGHPLVPH